MSFKLSCEVGTIAENDDIQEQIEIEGGILNGEKFFPYELD